ncbi:hypothetical protein HPB50_020383 [Hyalomma asiaticum]|uniref:Uncharacterized protein n=1 Tax=Hyalomma asiaticum TaxID=266040 RepID=A0ACB7RQ87_HYAAI|nr:hypothetical protein HPB50_020383 [Hyalomma asiaticum]
MVKMRHRQKVFEAYKDFIRTVLSLFLGSEDNDLNPTGDGHDSHESSSDEKQVAEELQSADQKGAPIEQVIKDIMEVETKIAAFPFLAALSMDVERAKRTLANNYEVGVHLFKYFERLIKYLETLEMRKLINYIGWYFAREVADVMTVDIRNKLNRFLRRVAKPGVQVNLNGRHCIDKLIGYHGVMEDGVTHLYLQKYFDEKAIKKGLPLTTEYFLPSTLLEPLRAGYKETGKASLDFALILRLLMAGLCTGYRRKVL